MPILFIFCTKILNLSQINIQENCSQIPNSQQWDFFKFKVDSELLLKNDKLNLFLDKLLYFLYQIVQMVDYIRLFVSFFQQISRKSCFFLNLNSN